VVPEVIKTSAKFLPATDRSAAEKVIITLFSEGIISALFHAPAPFGLLIRYEAAASSGI